MALRIQNNVEAFNAHRNLAGTESALATSMERLSSGYRINRAADDAAGLAISERLRCQIGRLDGADGGRLADGGARDAPPDPRPGGAVQERLAVGERPHGDPVRGQPAGL